MLKIWLTWLQPSLGILGTALVLLNPLCTYAATKPFARNTTPKAPTQVSQWSTIKLSSTKIDRESSSKIALTPDLAVRQLAVNSMTAGTLPTSAKVKTPQIGGNAVASFMSPSVNLPKTSAKATKQAKPQYVRNSVAAALAQAINPQSPVPVPGIYIGNNPKTASKVAPIATVASKPIDSTEIGAPTPLSAMMAAKTAIDPFPVVRPELMQKLDRNPVAAKPVPVVDLSPIANIPTTKPQSIAPKTILPQAKANPAATPYKSLDPIANIPSGLQRLLGNNLNSQPIVASAPVKAKANKTNSLLALRQLISPSTPTVPSVNAASLQLATAQAYTANVPKFSIPGETMLTAKQFQPMKNLVVAKRTQKNFSAIIASNQRSNTTTLAPTKQPWMVVDRRNSLGGLILGSQPLTSVPQVASLLPTNTSAVGLPVRNLVNFN